MSWTYACPKCAAMLNPHETVILTARQRDRRLLIGLHPQPGNYQIYLPPDVELVQGETWEFFCPVCHADLVTEEDPNLCAVNLLGQEKPKRVLFSRVAGEKATYIVTDRVVEGYHGEHAETYMPLLVSIRY